jgi:uncharacterized membrane protein
MNKEVSETRSQTKKVALTSILAALIAVTTMIAIPMPPPLSTITMAPVIIFVTAILLGPSAGLISSIIGSAIGYLGGTTIGTISGVGGLYYWYLFGIAFARGPMGFSVGLLRKKNEIVAMITGVVIETLLFFALDIYLIGFWVALADFGTLIDLIFVPIALMVLVAVRRILDVTYLA